MTATTTVIRATMPTSLAIASIRTDGGTQPRAAIDYKVIEAYLDSLEAGAKFPPVDVFYDGTDYWLADGFHRHRTFEAAGRDDIPVTVHQGSVQDAQWFSFAANKTNGNYRSNEDKHRAVKAALKHPNGAKSSDSQIGKHVGVDHKTVAGWREKLFPSREIPKIRTVTRKGTTYQQDTTNIGRKSEAEPEAAMVVDPETAPTGKARTIREAASSTSFPLLLPTGRRQAQQWKAARIGAETELYRIAARCLKLSELDLSRVTAGSSIDELREMQRMCLESATRLRAFAKELSA